MDTRYLDSKRAQGTLDGNDVIRLRHHKQYYETKGENRRAAAIDGAIQAYLNVPFQHVPPSASASPSQVQPPDVSLPRMDTGHPLRTSARIAKQHKPEYVEEHEIRTDRFSSKERNKLTSILKQKKSFKLLWNDIRANSSFETGPGILTHEDDFYKYNLVTGVGARKAQRKAKFINLLRTRVLGEDAFDDKKETGFAVPIVPDTRRQTGMTDFLKPKKASLDFLDPEAPPTQMLIEDQPVLAIMPAKKNKGDKRLR